MAAAVPLAIAAYSAYSSHRAASQAQQEQTRHNQASEGLARGSAADSQRLNAVGMPLLTQAGNYYSTLLNGSRGAMENATAGARGLISDTYRGAESSLRDVRGPDRDRGMAEIARSRASDISRLTMGVQPAAAQGAFGVAGSALGYGQGATGRASSIYDNLAYGAGQRRDEANANTRQSGQQMGSMLAWMLQNYGGGGRGTSAGGGQSAGQRAGWMW